MTNKIKKINNYLSLVKFSHTVFALPFALLSFVWAIKKTDGELSITTLVLIIVCMVTARNCAMAFNRIVDRKFDKKNPRTSSREIPSGKISTKNATIFVIANCILFIISSAMINNLTFLLSPIALMIVMGYSLTKRFSWLCHYVLGLSLGIAPVAAYISVTGEIALFPVLLCFVVMSWVSSFDIIYSLQDEQFDRENHLFSIPVVLGRVPAMILSSMIHVITILLVIYIGVLYNLNAIYWVGVILFSIILVWEHIIVKPNDISKANVAFATMNSIGGLGYCIITILSLYL